MERLDVVAKWAIVGLGSAASFVFGGLTMVMGYLLLANVLDFFTGYIAGAKTTGLSSNKNYLGIRKKIMLWVAISLAHIVDKVLGDSLSVVIQGIDIGIPEQLLTEGHVIRDAVVLLYLFNELLSITENIGKVTWVPPILRKIITVLKPSEENKGGE